MDGDEEVTACVIGKFAAVLEFDEMVVAAGKLDGDIRILRGDFGGKAFGNIEGDIFLEGLFVCADTAGVGATVAGINNHGAQSCNGFSGLCRHRDCKEKGGKRQDNGETDKLHGCAVLKIME